MVSLKRTRRGRRIGRRRQKRQGTRRRRRREKKKMEYQIILPGCACRSAFCKFLLCCYKIVNIFRRILSATCCTCRASLGSAIFLSGILKLYRALLSILCSVVWSIALHLCSSRSWCGDGSCYHAWRWNRGRAQSVGVISIFKRSRGRRRNVISFLIWGFNMFLLFARDIQLVGKWGRVGWHRTIFIFLLILSCLCFLSPAVCFQ